MDFVLYLRRSVDVGYLQAQAVPDGGGAKKSDKKLRKKGATDESPEDFIDPETPAGQKKLLAPQMAKQYSPAAVEKSYAAFVSPISIYFYHQNFFITQYKKYVDIFFYLPSLPFFHAAGMLGGNHLDISKQMQQAQSYRL